MIKRTQYFSNVIGRIRFQSTGGGINFLVCHPVVPEFILCSKPFVTRPYFSGDMNSIGVSNTSNSNFEKLVETKLQIDPKMDSGISDEVPQLKHQDSSLPHESEAAWQSSEVVADTRPRLVSMIKRIQKLKNSKKPFAGQDETSWTKEFFETTPFHGFSFIQHSSTWMECLLW